MPNDVEIHVKANDDTSSGFAKARASAKQFETDVVAGAKAASQAFGKGLSDVAENLNLKQPITSVFTQAGLAAAPALAGIISGAVTGAAAGAGLAGGVALAARDPRVKAAGEELGKNLLSGLEGRSGSFVAPVLQSIDLIERKFEESGDTIQGIFANSSRFLLPLVDAATDAGQSILEGVEIATERAGPVMEAFGEGFRDLGDASKDLFDDLSSDSESSAASIQAAFSDVKAAIEITSETLKILNSTFGWLDENIMSLTLWDQIEELPSKWGDVDAQLGDTVGTWVEGNEAMADSTRAVSSALQELAETQLAAIDPAFGLLNAQDSLAEAQRDYNEAVEKYGKESPKAEAALRRSAEAAFELEAAAGAAGAAVGGQLTGSMKATLRQAGWTTAQIASLESQLNSAAAAANAWQGVYTQTFITNYESYGLKSPSAMGGFQGLAHGGIKGAASGGGQSGLTWVGEHGPELVALPAGSSVKTNNDSMRMASGGSSSVDVLVRPAPSANRDLVSLLVESLQYECRTRYDGSAQKMIGT